MYKYQRSLCYDNESEDLKNLLEINHDYSQIFCNLYIFPFHNENYSNNIQKYIKIGFINIYPISPKTLVIHVSDVVVVFILNYGCVIL